MKRTLLVVLTVVCLGQPIHAAQSSAPVAQSGNSPEQSSAGSEQERPPTYAETVVVTASRIEESILDAPVVMTVVSPVQVASSPASSVAELLQGVGGLNVIQLNAREFQIAGRQATGILGQGQLVLLDGRPVNNGNSGMFWDQLPIDLDDVDRVEILHGPASMVWGANAMSAVVNIRTKTPRQVQGLRVTTGAGERGVAFGSIRYAGVKNRASYRLSGRYDRADGWERPTRLPDGSPMTGYLVYSNPWISQPKGDARFDYDLGDGRLLTVHGGYAGSSGMSFSGDLPLEFQRGFFSGFADLAYTAPSLDARVSWGRSGGDYRSLTDSSIHAVSSTYPTAEVNVRRALATRHLIVAGASGRLDYWHLEIVPRRTSRHEAGGYVEDQIFLGQRFRLNVGGRLDWVQTSGPSASPRAGVLFKPVPQQSVHVAVSRGYRVPTPVENFVDFAAAYAVAAAPDLLVPYSVIGNGDLRETPNVGIEAGYTAELRGGHTVQATVYRSTTTDLIRSAPIAFYSPSQPPPRWPFPPAFVPEGALPSTFSYVNSGRLRNEGIEIAVNSGWSSAVWSSASFTFQATPLLSDVRVAYPVNKPPRHQASGIVGWNVAPWRGSVGVTYADRAFWADVFPADPRLTGYSPSYTTTNASLAYRLQSRPVELVLNATNLFDRKIQQHVYGDVIRRSVVGSLRIDVKP